MTKDDGAVGDHLAKGAKIIRHLLETATVVSDGKVGQSCGTLSEHASWVPRNWDSTASPVA